MPASRAGLGDHVERRRELPGRVADRAPAAGAAVVEREDAAQLSDRCSFASIASRAASSASSSFAGVLAAGLRHRVAAAAAAADHCGGLR